MQRMEVKSNEYKIVNIQEDLILYTNDLNEEIAYSFFSMKFKRVCLGRNLTPTQLIKLFSEMNPNNLSEQELIKVHIIGGNESEKSEQYLMMLLQQLQIIDNNKNIIDIKSFDTGSRIHPNSFEVDCYHGGVRKIESF